ncbi:hypothetical protein BXZ70DRAFT_774660 [Cristinia sonorae]|uniref:Uncharacterized protein n=1 Tax=Cristinia sonorae TaxID=1940300 RepID=A0A8K0USC4_9AGAR|nr:hypothetical protein BXZ70DRAFT_774660 [Cristinia sonorae]
MNVTSLPNPSTSLAWLPPDVAMHVENTRYILTATAGVWVWDLLMGMPDLIRIYSSSSFKALDAIYFTSRITTGLFIFTTLALNVVAVDNCEALAKVVGWIGAVTLPLHTLSFFFCARAVFHDFRRLLAMLAILWLASLGASVVTPFFIHAQHIGDTKQCLVDINEVFATGIVFVALNNGVTFILISTQLARITQATDVAETWSGRMKTFLRRDGYGKVTKMLMATGQSYVLPVVISNVVAAVINLIPSIPAPFRLSFVVLNVMIHSCMTARIHRNIKLGIINPEPSGMTTVGTDHQTLKFRKQAHADTIMVSQVTQVDHERRASSATNGMESISTFVSPFKDEQKGALGTYDSMA